MDLKRKVFYPVAFVALVVSFFFDEPLFQFIWNFKLAILDKPMLYLSYLGGSFTIFFIVLAILAIVKKKQFIIPYAMAMFSALLLTYLLKLGFARDRPYVILGLATLVTASTYSFPSGHATAMFASIQPLSKAFYKLRYVVVILAVLVAFSRVYLGVHFVSDVIAGMLIGFASGDFFIKSEKSKWMKKINFLA